MDTNFSCRDFKGAAKARKYYLPEFEFQEIEIIDFCKANPLNVNREVVERKIHLLNKYYSTRVPVEVLIDKILSIEDFDLQLQSGNISLVNKIADCDKDYFSFATKYCAMHQPEKYPIYDSLVWKFLSNLKAQRYFEGYPYISNFSFFGPLNNGRSFHYAEYVNIYNEFLKRSGAQSKLNYREVDFAIWGLIKIQLTYGHNESAFSKIWPTAAANLISNILWQFIRSLF